MAAGSTSNIAVIGLSRSGKTTLLVVLRRVMHTPWSIKFGVSAMNLIQMGADSLDDGFYPGMTDVSTKDDYQFSISRSAENFILRKRQPIEMQVRTIDYGGENFRFDSKNEFRQPATDIYDRYLHQCQGIMFLIDPAHQWAIEDKERKRYNSIFFYILNYLNLRPPGLSLHTAFCISKVDSFLTEPEAFKKLVPNYADLRAPIGSDQFQQDLKACADKRIFKDNGATLQVINNFCSESNNYCQWFACSATGWVALSKPEYELAPRAFREQHAEIASNENGVVLSNKKRLFPQWYQEVGPAGPEARIFDSARLGPYGVAEPLQWLFTEIAKKKSG